MAEAAGADWLHVDVMDGHFVPNISFGAPVMRGLKTLVEETNTPFDVHLMIAPIDPYLEAFAEAGADIITVHPEAGPHIHRTLQAIRGAGMKAGVALNPGTPVEAVAPLLDDVDLVLVMTVNPGFGGQKFIPASLDKIARVRQRLDAAGSKATLQVDGGVTADNAADCVAAGADALVAGTAVFRGGPSAYADNIAALKGR